MTWIHQDDMHNVCQISTSLLLVELELLRSINNTLLLLAKTPRTAAEDAPEQVFVTAGDGARQHAMHTIEDRTGPQHQHTSDA